MMGHGGQGAKKVATWDPTMTGDGSGGDDSSGEAAAGRLAWSREGDRERDQASGTGSCSRRAPRCSVVH